MNHCSDDDLVLHYYDESPAAVAHVATCAACAARSRDVAAVLTAMDIDVPERDERYGADVWDRIRPHLEQRSPSRVRVWRGTDAGTSATLRWALAAAATIVLLVGGFAAGRMSMARSATVAPTRAQADEADPLVARRALLLTVADHFERSERVLTDIMNTSGPGIVAEQQWAGDLIAANRLYRQDALAADESSVATVLDELERALLDIVHRPADMEAADLVRIRQRIDSAALLFKVRVMTNELRQRQFGSDPPSDRSTIPVS